MVRCRGLHKRPDTISADLDAPLGRHGVVDRHHLTRQTPSPQRSRRHRRRTYPVRVSTAPHSALHRLTNHGRGAALVRDVFVTARTMSGTLSGLEQAGPIDDQRAAGARPESGRRLTTFSVNESRGSCCPGSRALGECHCRGYASAVNASAMNPFVASSSSACT